MLALGIMELLEARREAWKQAVDASDNVTLAIAQEIERNIETYDLSIKGAISALKIPGIENVSPEIRQAAMFDTSTTAKYLGTVLILDKNGDIKWTSIPSLPVSVNFSDRDYFGILRDRPQDGLFVSRPFASRLRHGDPSIAFVRRLDDADGNFDGIAQGAMRLAYFQDMFQKLNLGPNGSISLVRIDGRLLARFPLQARYIDQDLSVGGIYKNANVLHGHFQAISSADGIERYFTTRRIGDLPLVLISGISIDGVYAAWWGKAIRVSAILILLSVITCTLCALFRREMSRRRGAETALVEAADKMALMANSDSLTGLANRRAFDTALEVEWKRAIRSELPVALIMVDADYFKLYNDLYGHPEGDRILRSIAGCIDKAIRRPADFAARYGGEEFVLVLPETERTGALMIAERIRNSVEMLQIAHDASPLGHLTVSIGLAWAIPSFGSTKEGLLKDCDLALYRAKHLGRNAVYIAADLNLESVD
jgi:diguanylate cyclase (GGDEF)-like protein